MMRSREPLSFEVTLESSFDDCVERVTAALKAEGFGVLTRADLHTAFKVKLGKDFRSYSILGACNPPLAHQALTERPEVGLMLPCNVTVEEVTEGNCLVRIINPEAMMQSAELADDPGLAEVGNAAKASLTRVAEALAGRGEARSSGSSENR